MRLFIKKISEFILAISVAASTVLVILGCLIIARPDLVSIIISYGIGIGCILFGIALGLSLIRSKVERNLQKSEQ